MEDDEQTKSLIARYLQEQSCSVTTASNGRKMERCLAEHSLDLIVLDLMLPGEDGLSLCRRLRISSAIPIIMLTAKGEDIDRIIGLEMGADDYLSKPFNPRELLARIRSILRRQAGLLDRPGRSSARLRFQEWILDLRLRELRDPEGAKVQLTGAEFELLQAFCERPGRILTRDGLRSMTRSKPAMPFGRNIDVLVSRLRRKIDRIEGASLIKTVRAGGYIFTPHVEDT